MLARFKKLASRISTLPETKSNFAPENQWIENLKMTFAFGALASFQELRPCYFWKRYLKGSNNQVYSRKQTFSRLHCRMKSQKVNSKSSCSLHVLAPLFFLAVKQWAIVGGFNPVEKEYEKNMGHLPQIGDDHTKICIYIDIQTYWRPSTVVTKGS